MRNLTQLEIDHLVARLQQGPSCCYGRFCVRDGVCPETHRMLANIFPRQSIIKRLLAEIKNRKEAY